MISVPAWGPYFVDLFCEAILPRLRAAARAVPEPIKLVCHTDSWQLIVRHAGDLAVECRPVPAGHQWFNSMSRSHREVLSAARPGDAVVLLTADMLPSENTFTACRASIVSGKNIVVINATRALAESVLPYRPTSRELSEWGWRHRHPIIRNCTWPDGSIDDMSRVYFHRGDDACCRLWLAHPLAVYIDGRALPFGPTIDCDLVTNYRPDEVHVVTSPDELAVVELSPATKVYGSRDLDEPAPRADLPPLSKRYRGIDLNPEVYRHILLRRIVVAGTGDGCDDDEAVRRALA